MKQALQTQAPLIAWLAEPPPLWFTRVHDALGTQPQAAPDIPEQAMRERPR